MLAFAAPPDFAMNTHPALLLRCLLLLVAPLGALFAATRPAAVTTALTPEDSRLVIDVRGTPPPVPLFFSAVVEQTIRLDAAELAGEMHFHLHVVQGHAETFSLGLAGDGEIVEVTGNRLRDWSVRRAVGGARFLDLRVMPLPTAGAGPAPNESRDFEFTTRTRVRDPAIPGRHVLPTATPGDAVGFSTQIALQPARGIEARVPSARGLIALDSTVEPSAPRRFSSTGEHRLEVELVERGAAATELELVHTSLAGKVDEAARSVAFRLRGQLRAQKAGARLPLLSGHAALTSATVGDGWHVELEPDVDGDTVESSVGDRRPVTRVDTPSWHYELVADREGALVLELAFAAAIASDGDWRALDFTMPAGAIVPLELTGLDEQVVFKTDAAVVPAKPASAEEPWRGFLPASGAVSLAWRHTREAAEGALFFTSAEQTEVRIAAGLLRATTQLSFRILQGKLPAVRCRLEGTGDVLGVEGDRVVGWKVTATPEGRVLEIQLSRPFEAEGALTIRSQAELGGWPVRVEPLRLAPEGGVRHSGFLRVANQGAVRIEVSDTSGLLQLAPEQFPGGTAAEDARQVFVYRIPAASYRYRVLATQVQPEIGIATIVTYELADNARILHAALDLDVREAPLRDWSLRIPADYAVVAVTGSDVADYVAETETTNGLRTLRVLFDRAIEGRQLLELRLEKNLAAGAGDWVLPPLQFPGAKTVRGHVGAVAAAGFRLVPAQTDRLVEVPLGFFPRQTVGLQQAWRMREPDWSATLRIETLGQSVQADVFHLYLLKQGAVHGSVLINYFVVGAPATEWRVEVPASLGNIDVIGQNVRRDWRRERDQVIVALHQPVLGAATLLITFEQPMSARGGVISPGEVRPLGVQSERGFVQVVSPLQVKHAIRRSEGALLKLEPAELPAEFRLLTSSPSLATYHYTARPFALELNVEPYAPADVVEQVIDFARLTSQVSRDGQVVTEAKFFVKTRGRKALRLVLPRGVQLWEARVDDEVVNARADGELTLVPLPARNNPGEPVAVALRLGQPATGAGSIVQLLAPRAAAAPTIVGEWIVHGDTGRVLVPDGGNVPPTQPPLTETGFEWISTRGSTGTFLVCGAALLAAWLLLRPRGWRVAAGLFFATLAMLGAGLLASSALLECRPNLQEISFAATVMPAGEAMAVRLDNLPEWQAFVVWWGLAAVAAGSALLMLPQWLGARRPARVPSHYFGIAGVALLFLGLLAQHGGAALFFGAGGVFIVVRLVVPALRHWRDRRESGVNPLATPGAGAAGAVSLLTMTALLGFGAGPHEARAGEPARETPAMATSAGPAAQSLAQRWSIRKDRLFAEVELTVRGRVGESFLLLRPPAVLTDFQGDGLRVSKVGHDGATAYYIAPEREGTLTAQARFELPLGNTTRRIPVPTGPAATQRIAIDLDQPGWEFTSPMTVAVLAPDRVPVNHSGATLVLAPHVAPVIELQPRRRDTAAETTQFFAESATLFVPAPGVVNGLTRVTVRPVQGRISELVLAVPAGLTIGEVNRGPIGAWRFDPHERRLRVPIEPAQTGTFSFDVATQLGAGDLPFALTLEPLRVNGATSDIGTLAVAFGADAQPESVRATGLSAINGQDFDATLLPHARSGQPLATLQHVWRYGAAGGRVELTVAPVAPEVRVSGRQLLTLDDDRLLMSVELHVAITRVGLFKLSLVLPEALEIETLTGAALSHWTETAEATQRIVTLHLNGRTLGEQVFHLTLAGATPGAQEAWPLPRLVVREAMRQTGEAVIVPGKGLRLRAVDREKVTQLDPRDLGAQQPGTLAFRLLQNDWVLRLGLTVLDPWLTVQSLQEVTLREGQTLTRIAARLRVENAAVKHVRVKLPGLSDDAARTLRATGGAVSDIVRVADAPDTWEIRFQRGIAGETDVQIEFQAPASRSAGQNAPETIATPEFAGARQTQHYVAVRSGGRLELDAPVVPRGWTRSDWNAVPAPLQQRSDRSVPSLCFRVAEPEAALVVTARRNAVADALKLRVTQADLLTLFAPRGAFLTAIDLKIDVLEKSTLRVRLPGGAQLFNTFVNGESTAVVRDGDAFLFYVSPNTGAERTAAVRLVYSVTPAPPATSRIPLLAPSLSVPLENVTWRVALPPGYDLADYRGGLRLRDESAAAAFGLDDYRSAVSSKRSAEAAEAMSLLQQANAWMQRGEQEKASRALSQVSNNLALDAASNEDARVQLRNLKTQQTVLGLATRRQRLYLDNRADAARNEPLEHAANLNPILTSGASNVKPQEFDRLLTGNTAEENVALRTIAARIVDQQLGTEPAPGALDVTLPPRGRVVTFTRSLQVDGAAPLALNLRIVTLARPSGFTLAGLLLAIVGFVAVEIRRRGVAR